MKVSKALIYLLIPLNSLAQPYLIPGATEQPDWVFPLWFEDGSGAKDTIYFAYDSDGQDFGWPQSDTVFGEKLIQIDTSKFNAYWESGFLLPNALKVLVWGNIEFGSGISFVNTYYPPLIVRWDPDLFYDEIIPYPNLDPLPDACGEFTTFGDMSPAGCSYMYPIIITDTTQGGGLVCYFSDSIVYTTGSVSGLSFRIIPWEPNFLSIENYNNQINSIQIYPNPVINNLFLSNRNNDEYRYQLFNAAGGILLTGFANTSINLDFTNYSPGIYNINIISNNLLTTHKIIKL